MSSFQWTAPIHGLDPATAAAFADLETQLQTWMTRQQQEWLGSATFLQPRCRYFLSSAQSLVTATDTAISFAATGQEYDVYTILGNVQFDNGARFGSTFLRAAGTYFIPPIQGQYLAIGQVTFAANATGKRDVWLQQRNPNGTTTDLALVRDVTPSAGDASVLQASAVVTIRNPAEVSGEDAIRLMVHQTSGGALDASAGYASTWLQLIKLS